MLAQYFGTLIVNPSVIFSEQPDQFAQCVYVLESRAICVKPNSYEVWKALADKYCSVVSHMVNMIDFEGRNNARFTKEEDRANLRLEPGSSFYADLNMLTVRALNCLKITLQLTTDSSEKQDIANKIALTLYSVIDCRKYYFPGYLDGLQISNTCFDYLEMSKCEQNYLATLLSARLREQMEAPSSEYLPLYLQALKIPKSSKLNEEALFYFTAAKLDLLKKGQSIEVCLTLQF